MRQRPTTGFWGSQQNAPPGLPAFPCSRVGLPARVWGRSGRRCPQRYWPKAAHARRLREAPRHGWGACGGCCGRQHTTLAAKQDRWLVVGRCARAAAAARRRCPARCTRQAKCRLTPPSSSQTRLAPHKVQQRQCRARSMRHCAGGVLLLLVAPILCRHASAQDALALVLDREGWALSNERGFGNVSSAPFGLPIDAHLALRAAGLVADPLFRCVWVRREGPGRGGGTRRRHTTRGDGGARGVPLALCPAGGVSWSSGGWRSTTGR